MKTFPSLTGFITTNKMDPDCLYCKNKGKACASHMDWKGYREEYAERKVRAMFPYASYSWLENGEVIAKYATTNVANKNIRKAPPYMVDDD